MAIPLAIPLIIGGMGAIANAVGSSRARGQQRRQFSDIRGMLGTQLGGTPFSVEDLIRQQLGGGANDRVGIDLSDLTTATDPILQSIRRGPNTSFLTENLTDIGETGNPFDMTQIIESLNPLRKRERESSLASLRAGAPGLGARFGSAQLGQESGLLSRLSENNAALDAQLLFQGYESSQQRRLQALQQLLGVDAQQLTREQSALQGMFGRANIGLGQGRLDLAGRGQNNSLLQLLLQAESTRRQQGIQSAGVLGGLAVPGSGFSSAGGAGLSMANLLLLSQLFGNQGQTTTG